MDEQSLFLRALEESCPEQWGAWLDAACGENKSLKQHILGLLQRHQEAQSFLERPPVEFGVTHLQGLASAKVGNRSDTGQTVSFVQGQPNFPGNIGQSVLGYLEQTIDVPRVVLRESDPEDSDPIIRPKSPEMPIGNSFSRYRLDGEIARGGMGAIIKGRDIDLGRDLAIKVLLDVHKDKPEVIQRFIEEAQIGGQLQHPGIAPIYELGQFSNNRPFFSMKLVKGKTLSKLLADRNDVTEDRARFLGIFEQVCQTMAYAHSRGVIHRDLKPANIMVGAFGEVQVMDWGLAKVLLNGGVADEKNAHYQQDEQNLVQTLRSNVGSDGPGTFGTPGSHTQMGSVMGTPAYMPPEQALGRIDSLDERADVFGLGAILCEILTGKPPYVGSNGTQVFRMASRGKLTDCFARLDACGGDAELLAITRDCLELDVKDRPRDAGVLAERLTSHLVSVESRLRTAEVDRAAQLARAEEALQTAKVHEVAARHERRARKLQLGLAAIVLGVLAVGGVIAIWMAAVQSRLKNDALGAERDANRARERETTQRSLAEAAKTLAEVERNRAETTLADMHTDRGLLAHREGDLAMAALWFANAAQQTPHDSLRAHANELRTRNWLRNAIVPAGLINLDRAVLRRAAFQPNGSWLLTLDRTDLRVWDWQRGEALLWTRELTGVTDAAWSPDGTQVAVAFGDGEVRLVEPGSGTQVASFRQPEGAEVLSWSPDGRRLAVGGVRVQLWNVARTPICESDWPHPQKVYGLVFNQAGTRLATACRDDLARVFAVDDASLSAPLFPPVEHVPTIRSVRTVPVFCDGDKKLVTFLKTHQPGWWDTFSGESIAPVWPVHPDRCDRSLSCSSDGKWIVASSYYYSCLLWNVDGTSRILPHVNQVEDAVFSPDGKSLLTSCWDGTARIWRSFRPEISRFVDLAATRKPQLIPQLATKSQVVAYSSDGAFAAIGTQNRIVIWKLTQSGPTIGNLEGVQNTLSVMRASFDRRLATIGRWHSAPADTRFGNQLKVVLVENGNPVGSPIPLDGELIDSCICFDNRSVAAVVAGEQTGQLVIHDVASGARVLPVTELPAKPLSVASAPNRHQVSVLCANGELLVVDTQSGDLQHRLKHEVGSETLSHERVAYSPDGSSLIIVTSNSRVWVRNPVSCELRFPPLNPVVEGGPCRDIAFSADSRWLATATNGKNMVRVWDLKTGQETGPGLPHPGDYYGIFAIDFSPNGEQIITGHKDGHVRIWDWRSGQRVGGPMWQGSEIYDVGFTFDGRCAIVAGNGELSCWDIPTSKRIAPPVLVSPHTFTNLGSRLLVAGDGFPIVDLSVLLDQPDSDGETMRILAELATGQRIQNGEPVSLDEHEWRLRWERFTEVR